MSLENGSSKKILFGLGNLDELDGTTGSTWRFLASIHPGTCAEEFLPNDKADEYSRDALKTIRLENAPMHIEHKPNQNVRIPFFIFINISFSLMHLLNAQYMIQTKKIYTLLEIYHSPQKI